MQLQACGDVLDSTRPIKFQSSEGDYINKENTDPASTVPPIGSRSNIYASRMPVSTPQSVDKGARSVHLTNCQIQINLAPRKEKNSLDDFDMPFKDDLHVFDILGHHF